jgi:hypothetical protein
MPSDRQERIDEEVKLIVEGGFEKVHENLAMMRNNGNFSQSDENDIERRVKAIFRISG